MTTGSPTRADRQLGAMLDHDAVERLRQVVVWMQKNRGLRLKDIATGCDVPEHTVRNFTSAKSLRPDNAFLGRLNRYVAGYRDVLPDKLALPLGAYADKSAEPMAGKPVTYEFLRMEVPLDELDVRRVYDRYAGYYLCFRRSNRPNHISVSWLHIRALNPKSVAMQSELPLPRFTLYLRYPDRLDPAQTDSYLIGGYVTARHGRIFFTGAHDGDLKFMILKEPPLAKITYLEGLCLLTSIDEGNPFAARIVCQYLGSAASRDSRRERTGLFTFDVFRQNFKNAAAIERALGDPSLLLSNGSG